MNFQQKMELKLSADFNKMKFSFLCFPFFKSEMNVGTFLEPCDSIRPVKQDFKTWGRWDRDFSMQSFWERLSHNTPSRAAREKCGQLRLFFWWIFWKSVSVFGGEWVNPRCGCCCFGCCFGARGLKTGWSFVDDIPKDAKKWLKDSSFRGPVCALAGLLERVLNINLSKTLQSHLFIGTLTQVRGKALMGWDLFFGGDSCTRKNPFSKRKRDVPSSKTSPFIVSLSQSLRALD